MLSQSKLNNIHKLKPEEQLQILHECAEALGLVDIKQAEKATGLKKRTIYDHMHNSKIGKYPLGDHIFPLLNFYR